MEAPFTGRFKNEINYRVCLILKPLKELIIKSGFQAAAFFLVSVKINSQPETCYFSHHYNLPPALGKNQGINLQVLHYPYVFYLQLSNRSLIGP